MMMLVELGPQTHHLSVTTRMYSDNACITQSKQIGELRTIHKQRIEIRGSGYYGGVGNRTESEAHCSADVEFDGDEVCRLPASDSASI